MTKRVRKTGGTKAGIAAEGLKTAPDPWSRVSALVFVSFFCLYLLTMSESLTSRNSGEGFMRIGSIENLLNYGTLAVGGIDDKWGSPGRGGLRYNWHEFGQNVFVLPLYLFLRDSGFAFYIVNALSTALTAVFILNICRLIGIGIRPAFFAAFAYGAGTLAWFYGSKVPHEHAIAVVTIVAATYFIMLYQQGRGRRYLVYCAIAMGLGFITRHDSLLAAAPLFYYLFAERDINADRKFSASKAALIAAVVFLPFLFSVFYYNYYRFGDIFVTGRAAQAQERHWALEFLPRGLIGALLSPGRSIFLFSPALLLFPFSLKAFFKKAGGRLFITFTGLVVMYLLFYSLHHSWDGEWCFGPRYFLVLSPFMMVSIAALFDSLHDGKRWLKILTIAVIVLSIAVQVSFSVSNWWLTNVIKYGIDDDNIPEFKGRPARDFGYHGSWKWLRSFFPIKDAQFFNQHKLTWYTLNIYFDPARKDVVYKEIYRTDYWFILYYRQLIETPDYWWLQRKSGARAAGATGLWAVFLFASAQAFRVSRRES